MRRGDERGRKYGKFAILKVNRCVLPVSMKIPFPVLYVELKRFSVLFSKNQSCLCETESRKKKKTVYFSFCPINFVGKFTFKTIGFSFYN